ncbi:unnamed protein product [Trichobilharzia szidati]|nr:unnamed protein product [Trichobilharzia szidati]
MSNYYDNITVNITGTQHNFCLKYYLPNIFVAIFGFITLIFGSFGSLLTWIYLFMFRKSSKTVCISTTKSTATRTGGTTRTATIKTVTTRTDAPSNNTSASSAGGSDIQPKQGNLRASTQLLMASLAFVDFLGQNISCLRYTILALKQYDLRLFYTDIFCRLQLFAEYCCQDASAWYMCILTGERFWLMARPTSAYSMNKREIKPPAFTLMIVTLTIIGKNAVLLASSQDVCSEGYTDKTFFLIDLVYKCIIPFLILVTTSTGNLIIMQRQLIKMHSDHMSIGKGLSIITMSRKNKAKLPPTAAAMWEVVFACRMMVVSSIVFIIGALPMNLFKLANSNFKNVLTARDICSVTDIVYNTINILFWTCVGLRFYLYMFSSPRVRHDMFLIGRMTLVKINILAPLRRISTGSKPSQSRSVNDTNRSQGPSKN